MSSNYYDQHANEFYANTVDIDMSELRAPFLDLVVEGGRVLDAGCGSGRDTLAFLEAGLDVVPFDASRDLSELASRLIGRPVRVCRYSDIDDFEAFDGVWACASLLHVPRVELESVMGHLVKALRANGVFYASFKEGTSTRVVDGRCFTDMSLAQVKALAENTGLSPVHFWTTDDIQAGRNGERWINVLARKI
jgi:SAM-dependent methyltransferase